MAVIWRIKVYITSPNVPVTHTHWFHHLMNHSHCRRRRDSTADLSRVSVVGVNRIADDCERNFCSSRIWKLNKFGIYPVWSTVCEKCRDPDSNSNCSMIRPSDKNNTMMSWLDSTNFVKTTTLRLLTFEDEPCYVHVTRWWRYSLRQLRINDDGDYPLNSDMLSLSLLRYVA